MGKCDNGHKIRSTAIRRWAGGRRGAHRRRDGTMGL